MLLLLLLLLLHRPIKRAAYGYWRVHIDGDDGMEFRQNDGGHRAPELHATNVIVSRVIAEAHASPLYISANTSASTCGDSTRVAHFDCTTKRQTATRAYRYERTSNSERHSSLAS